MVAGYFKGTSSALNTMSHCAAHLQWDIQFLHGSIPKNVYREGSRSVTSDSSHKWQALGSYYHKNDESEIAKLKEKLRLIYTSVFGTGVMVNW